MDISRGDPAAFWAALPPSKSVLTPSSSSHSGLLLDLLLALVPKQHWGFQLGFLPEPFLAWLCTRFFNRSSGEKGREGGISLLQRKLLLSSSKIKYSGEKVPDETEELLSGWSQGLMLEQ